MITEVKLRNFKCFESETIPLGNLTLLTGLNGMGKSSMIQALLMLRQSYFDGLLPKTGLELNGTMIQMGTAKDVLYENAETDEFEIGLTWSDNEQVSFVMDYQRDADILHLRDKKCMNSIEMSRKTPFNDNIHYVKAERIGPRTVNSLSDYLVREHHQIGTAGEFVQHYLEVYGNKKVCDTKLFYNDSKKVDLLNQVQSWLNVICPGTKIHLSTHTDMDIIHLRYSFLNKSGEYRSTSVGFGITYALPVIVAILSSKPGGIVIIENPEAHLHPQGQSRLGELMARAASVGIQVIAETHSDHVLNGVRVATHKGLINPEQIVIHYFSRKEDKDRLLTKIETPKIDKNGRLDYWPEGFFDELDKDLEQLLTPNK